MLRIHDPAAGQPSAVALGKRRAEAVEGDSPAPSPRGSVEPRAEGLPPLPSDLRNLLAMTGAVAPVRNPVLLPASVVRAPRPNDFETVDLQVLGAPDSTRLSFPLSKLARALSGPDGLSAQQQLGVVSEVMTAARQTPPQAVFMAASERRDGSTVDTYRVYPADFVDRMSRAENPASVANEAPADVCALVLHHGQKGVLAIHAWKPDVGVVSLEVPTPSDVPVSLNRKSKTVRKVTAAIEERQKAEIRALLANRLFETDQDRFDTVMDANERREELWLRHVIQDVLALKRLQYDDKRLKWAGSSAECRAVRTYVQRAMGSEPPDEQYRRLWALNRSFEGPDGYKPGPLRDAIDIKADAAHVIEEAAVPSHELEALRTAVAEGPRRETAKSLMSRLVTRGFDIDAKRFCARLAAVTNYKLETLLIARRAVAGAEPVDPDARTDERPPAAPPLVPGDLLDLLQLGTGYLLPERSALLPPARVARTPEPEDFKQWHLQSADEAGTQTVTFSLAPLATAITGHPDLPVTEQLEAVDEVLTAASKFPPQRTPHAHSLQPDGTAVDTYCVSSPGFLDSMRGPEGQLESPPKRPAHQYALALHTGQGGVLGVHAWTLKAGVVSLEVPALAQAPVAARSRGYRVRAANPEDAARQQAELRSFVEGRVFETEQARFDAVSAANAQRLVRWRRKDIMEVLGITNGVYDRLRLAGFRPPHAEQVVRTYVERAMGSLTPDVQYRQLLTLNRAFDGPNRHPLTSLRGAVGIDAEAAGVVEEAEADSGELRALRAAVAEGPADENAKALMSRLMGRGFDVNNRRFCARLAAVTTFQPKSLQHARSAVIRSAAAAAVGPAHSAVEATDPMDVDDFRHDEPAPVADVETSIDGLPDAWA